MRRLFAGMLTSAAARPIGPRTPVDTPSSSTIPSWFPHRLRRHPALLSATIIGLNQLHRLTATPRRRVLVGVSLAFAGALVWIVVASEAIALAIHQALDHPAIVVAAAALYSASLIPKRRRTAAAAHARSWLVATPRAPSTRGVAILVAVLKSLFARWLGAAVPTLLMSLNTAVTREQSLTLLLLLTAGAAGGAIFGSLLGHRGPRRKREASRYTRHPRVIDATRPSAAGLARWPIAQALAWIRPENARLLLAVAILTIPGGIGPLAAAGLLASWAIVSYLGALFLAVPRVARTASDWLRSTPIAFWAFAWPLARRMLLHQFCGTVIGGVVMRLLGAAPSTALYAGTVWLAIVALVTASSLADCYRARSPVAKITLSVIAVLLAEQRARGWGISLAIILTALHVRGGTRHARA